MRTFRLLRLALEAEALRLRYQARRTISRAVCGIIALAFLIGVLVFGHIAVWFWLRDHFAGQFVALIILGVDLILCAIFALLAARSRASRAELEALDVRRRALDDAAASMTLPTLVLRAIESVIAARR